MTPTSPDGVNTGTLGNIDNQVNISVVVVVGTTGHLDVLVSHSDVIGVDLEIFRSGHDCELDGTLIAEGLVSPFSDGADLLNGSDTVVANEDLCDDTVTALLANEIGDGASRSCFERIAACCCEKMKKSVRTSHVFAAIAPGRRS